MFWRGAKAGRARYFSWDTSMRRHVLTYCSRCSYKLVDTVDLLSRSSLISESSKHCFNCHSLVSTSFAELLTYHHNDVKISIRNYVIKTVPCDLGKENPINMEMVGKYPKYLYKSTS